MIAYIIAAILFLIVILFYSILISKSKNVVDTSINLNNAMSKYFLLLADYEKILKEEDDNIKKEKAKKLLILAKEYCQNYPKSSYRKDIEKLVKKLEEFENLSDKSNITDKRG